uniref:Uncharacterized protein TCIL3000_11_6140 n=1 Tax=Trypanosoma congolense (strain IL3000) TaxID=1068625 RepID=G0V0M0_TRYCI|nr:unnamed protein product [Trypanosoma congolense IL3000]
MIESVYSLFSAHTDMEGGAVKCNSDASPTVVVATLSVNCPSSDASQGDESIQHLLSKLSEAYPSSSYMLAVGGPANTSTEARELLGELTVPHGNPKNFCCVVFDESRRPEVLVSGVNAFNPTWLDELREVLDDIQTPIQMVALLVIHMKFSMLLESFFQLIEECRRMGHTSTAGKLLSVVLRHINLSPETELTAMHRLECLKMSCSTVVEKNAIGDTSTDEFLVGIRVHGIPRSLAAVAGTAKGMEVEGLEPRRLLLVLHTGTDNAIGGIKNFGNCHKPLDELDALLQQLNLNDEVFISLAGRVTLPPTSVALARQQWRNMREIAMASLKHNFTAAIPMVTREIFGQTVPVLKKWRRKLLGQKIRRDTGAASPRIMVVLFTSQKPILIHGLVHSIISQEMLFFHVPIFCVSSSCGDPREAYKLLDLTSPGSVHCIETIDSDADVTLSPVEASRNNGKHDDDREISCSSTRGYLQQRPQAMRSIELLTLLLVATIRNTTHTGVSIILPSDGELCEDIYLDMGNIFSVLDRTLFISRAVDSLKNAAKLKRKAIFVAYSLDKEMYEIAYLTPTEIKGEIPSSDRPWWDRLKKSRKLLSSMPNDIRPTVSDCASSELLQSSAGGETFKCFMKQQENLAEWLTLNYNMLQLKGTPYIVVAGWYPNQKLRGCDGEGDAVGDSEQNINKLSPAAFPLVDSRWTNFATYDGAPITTIHAMLSRTFPFETLIERTASRTLALESLQNNCAAVRLASVKHAPALEHAQARLVALMSVDVSNGAMTLVRLMPAKSANDVRSGALHEMKDLRLQQMYCVVHLALRCSMTSDFFMRDDLLIADGISFFTARASVKNVKITSVTQRTADMMWEGTQKQCTYAVYP